MILLVLYGAAGEWTIVQNGWMALDPAFLFVLLALVFVLLTLPLKGSSNWGMPPLEIEVILPFFTLVLVSLACSSNRNSYWAQGGKYIFAITYDFLVFLFALYFGMRVCAIKGGHSLLLVTQGILALSVLGDLIVPTLFSPDPIRPAGIAVNPNRTAFMMCLMTSLTVRYDRARWSDIVFMSCSGATVLAAMSRAGLIYFASLVVLYALIVAKNSAVKLRSLVSFFALFLCCVGLLYYVTAYLLKSDMILGQGHTNSHLKMFLGDLEFEWLDPVRLELLTLGTNAFLDAPVLGNGTGYSQMQELGWHNTYLRMAVDTGLCGLIAYLWFLGACVRVFVKRHYYAGVVFLVVWFLEGFFNHSLIDNRGALILLGLALVHSSQSQGIAKEPRCEAVHLPRAV